MKMASLTVLLLGASACGISSHSAAAISNGPMPMLMPIDLQCSVAKFGANKINITPEIIAGAQMPTRDKIRYEGHEISVLFNDGDEFDGQQLLWITLDGETTQVFDPGHSLYKSGADDGVEVQCYLGSGATAPTSLNANKLRCSVDNNGSNREALETTIVSGARIVYTLDKTYNGHKIKAVFNKGDGFDSQQLLRITVDGTYTQVYSPKKSLFKHIMADGTQVQCYVED